MDPQNEEINSVDVEPVEKELANDDLNAILKLLQQKVESEQKKQELQLQKEEQQEKEKNEADTAQKIVDEQLEQKELEKQAIIEQKEQEYINSENEFRTNLIDSVDLQNKKMDTYIQKSDGLLASVDLMNKNTELLIQNTTVDDNAVESGNMSYYADLTLVMIIWVFLPLYISYRLIKPLFNKIF